MKMITCKPMITLLLAATLAPLGVAQDTDYTVATAARGAQDAGRADGALSAIEAAERDELELGGQTNGALPAATAARDMVNAAVSVALVDRHSQATRANRLSDVADTPAEAIVNGAYARSGWTAELSTLFHGVSGTVAIVDENSLRVDHFNYDGGGPAVFFYLGVDESNAAFTSGLAIPPQLTQAYSDETVFVDLPAGETLDGWNAVSVWCAEFRVNFGSGTFAPPPALLGDLNCDGAVNFGDIDPFVLAITAAGDYAAAYPDCDVMLADVNDDGAVNFGDIDPFVALITS